MKKRNKSRQRQSPRTKTSARIIWVVGTLGISFALIGGWLVFMNLQQVNDTRASDNGNKASGGLVNSGEILTEFTWEKNPVTMATLGPDAISVSEDAHSVPGGKSSTGGLSPGKNGNNINLRLKGNAYFDQEGLDICIDYRGSEKEGDLIMREGSFRFGFEKGLLAIAYRTENEKGGFVWVKERTDYELLKDHTYRTYRFIYNPSTGRGEILVNNAPIWNHDGTPNRAMYWKNAGDVMIAHDINGDGSDEAIIDNLVIRSTGTVSPLSASLVNFMLENTGGKINIHFESANEDMVSNYVIERSLNGIDFSKISSITPYDSHKKQDEYIVADQAPQTNGVLYYRIRQCFKNGKFITHPVAAVRLKTEKIFGIERINPSPFNSNFNISYFVPKPGRVWIQLNNSKGELMDSQTFEAMAGKNVHVSKNYGDLPTGTYLVNIVYDNKKITEKVIKI